MTEKIHTIQSSDKEEFEKRVRQLIKYGGELIQDDGYKEVKKECIIYSQSISFKNREIEFYNEKKGIIKSIKDKDFNFLFFREPINTLYEKIRHIDGVKIGPTIYYYTNGNKKLREEYLYGGILDGVEEWYENGNKKEMGRYGNEKKDGVWTKFFENGNLHSREGYDNGILKSHKSFYEEGGQRYFCGIKNGKDNGLCIRWDMSGNIIDEYWIKNGKYLKGVKRIYNDGHRRLEEKHFKNNKLHGLWTKWFVKGWDENRLTYREQKKSEKMYKKGKLISKKKWNRDGSPKK
jgi:antitoxin component YwqK of YwqJK toxin-antitoxin module